MTSRDGLQLGQLTLDQHIGPGKMPTNAAHLKSGFRRGFDSRRLHHITCLFSRVDRNRAQNRWRSLLGSRPFLTSEIALPIRDSDEPASEKDPCFFS